MTRALLLKLDDWEGLYVDGRLVAEGHHLGDAETERFWLKVAWDYDFRPDEFAVAWASEEDQKLCEEIGGFPARRRFLRDEY